MKTYASLLVLAVLFLSASNIYAYSGGDGSSGDPYQIASVDDFLTLTNTPADWSSSFILTADVNLAEVPLTPVGNGYTYFTGTFDGGGYKILNAVINQPGSDFVGLFGWVVSGGQIRNLGVEDVNITGQYYVGGLVGQNWGGTLSGCYSTGSVSGYSSVGGLVGYNGSGTLTGCYATGSVTGQYYVGGLVGYNYSGMLTGCYATGSVTGTDDVGGLVGYNDSGSLTSCYATGSVSGTDGYVGGLVGYNSYGMLTSCYATGSVNGYSSVGGLVGLNYGGTVTDSFWDIETSGQYFSDGGTGKNTADMMMQSTFTDAGWDFTDTDGNPPIWKIQENITYPHLFWEQNAQPQYTDGSGTSIDPYQIAKVADLQLLMASPADWNKYFIQTADINMQDIEMTPVGNDVNNFTGSFDGQNYIISNAYIWMPGSINVGFFGYVGNSAYISNIHLESVRVRGWLQVGSLIGRNDYSTVNNCYVTGVVDGIDSIGGLVGQNWGGTLSGCYSTGSVSGYSSVGGLVGYNGDGTLTSCYATGLVSGYTSVGGGNNVGGLVGNNWGGTLTSCYATGSVTGTDSVGGLIGENYYCSLTACYATGSVTGNSNVGGLVGYIYLGTLTGCFWDIQTSGTSDGVGNVDPDPAGAMGKNTADMMMQSTFTDFGWDFDGNPPIWKIQENITYPHLFWEQNAQFQYTGGSGTSIDPYQIAKVADLQLLMASPADWDKYFIQTADIDMQNIEMTPIGNDVNNFTGSFDGQSHIISNVYIYMPYSNYVGLFGYVGFGGQIRNLGVEDVNITGHNPVGGLVGSNSGSLTSCYATGSVSGTYYVGGLVGLNNQGTLTGCYATDSVNGSVNGSSRVGGLVGDNWFGTLTSCYATGSVSGNSSVGGLAGNNTYGSLTSCYATGSVTGTDSVGGLAGYNFYGSITSCYATGLVSGNSSVGGLMGYNDSGTVVTGCFWDTETSGTSDGVGNIDPDPAGATGKNTVDMKTLSTFTSAGWDFDNIWAICEGTNYPRLLWSIPAADLVCPDGVNFADYSFLAQRWLNTDCASNNNCDGADFDFSGTVDIADLKIFCNYWLEGVTP